MVMSTSDEILQEAKERYPIGTRYLDVDGQQEFTTNFTPTWWQLGYGIYAIKGGGLIYKQGRWAKILSLPFEIEPVSLEPEIFN